MPRLRHVAPCCLFGLVACTVAEGPEEHPQVAQDRLDSVPFASIDWSMPDVFGTELDANGIVRLSPSDDVRNRTAWQVTLDACGSSSPLDPIANYSWDIQLDAVAAPGIPTGPPPQPSHLDAGGNCAVSYTFPFQATFPVTLTVTTQMGRTATAVKDILVKNYLIVSIGDSIASGEGDPDVPADWSHPIGYPGNVLGPSPAVWSDRRCHRTHFAPAAQAALAYEQADRHSSVTFLSVACSGAQIVYGVSFPYAGQEAADPPLPPQIDQVAALIGNRPIDAMVVTAGANDIGFGNIVRSCAVPFRTCSNNDFPSIDLVQDTSFLLGLGLPSLLDGLGDSFRRSLNIYRVFITDYPDPTHDDRGNLCTNIDLPGAVSDQFTLLNSIGGVDGNFNQDEIRWMENGVVIPLDAAVRDAATRQHWNFVPISDTFTQHGSCATDHWVVRYDESKQNQVGPDANGILHQGDGSFHPNRAGHQAIAQRITDALAVLVQPVNIAIVSKPVPPTPVIDPVPAFNDMPFAATSRGANMLDVVYRGTDDALYHIGWDTGVLSAPENLGGVGRGVPSLINLGTSRLDLFVRGTDDSVYTKTWKGPPSPFPIIGGSDGFGGSSVGSGKLPPVGWTDYVALGGVIVDSPQATRDGAGRIDLFANGTNRAPFVDILGLRWTGWSSASDHVFLSSPVPVSWGPNRFDVFGMGSDGTLQHIWNENGGGGTESLGGLVTSLAATSWGDHRLDVIAIAGDQSMWHKAYDGSGWVDFVPMFGVATSRPAVVSWGPGRLDTFVRGTDGGLWHNWFSDGHWGWWENLGADIVGNPVATSRGADRLDVFVVQANGTIGRKTWDGANWLPLDTFENFGGSVNTSP